MSLWVVASHVARTHTHNATTLPTCKSIYVAKEMIIRADAMFSSTAQIKDAVANEYGRQKDIVGDTRMALTPHADATCDACFENQLLSSCKPNPPTPLPPSL